MFDNTNPYTLRTEIAGGITHYFVSFADGQAAYCETKVSRPVYLELIRLARIERNLRRWDERHTEQSSLTDETLYIRALCKPKGVEESFIDSQRDERLRQAVIELPEVGRRRFILYREFGLTYEQIAEMEGRSLSSVYGSIQRAIEKIKEKMKFFEI